MATQQRKAKRRATRTQKSPEKSPEAKTISAEQLARLQIKVDQQRGTIMELNDVISELQVDNHMLRLRIAAMQPKAETPAPEDKG